MKNHHQVLLGLAILASSLHFTSCSDDKDENVPEIYTDIKYDELEIFQNYLVECDTAGNFVQRLYGEAFDLTDTTKLIIPVEDLKQAKEYFCYWCVNENNLITLENGLVYRPTDSNGIAQGAIYFNAKDKADDTVIAEVTFSPGLDLKYVSSIQFVANDPMYANNGHSPHLFGDYVRMETEHDGEQNWVCIREAKPGVKGLLVFLSDQVVKTDGSDIYDYPSESMALDVSRQLRTDWDNYVAIFEDAGNRLSTYHYWLNKHLILGFSFKRYAIILKESKTEAWETFWRHPKLQYMQIRTFDMVD